MSNCSNVVIEDLSFSELVFKQGAAAVKIVNSQNITLKGRIQVKNVSVLEKSYFFYFENSTVFMQFSN